jgi:hypothetical protein
MIVQLFVYLQYSLWQAEVSLLKKSANYAPKFVQLAPKNVKNMHTWSIAKIVRKPVANVLLSAVI